MENALGSMELVRAEVDPSADRPPRRRGFVEPVEDLSTSGAASPKQTRQGDELARARARLIERVASGEVSVQDACREARISRARFYQLRSLYKAKGVEGLRPSYPQVRLDLRLPEHVESAIVAYALLNPLHGERIIARALAHPSLGGIKVSRHGVGEVLRRNGLSRREARVARAAGLEERPSAAPQIDPVESNWFSEIYGKYRGYVYGICLQHLRDPSFAEDAVQETFVRVYTNIARFDSRRSILPWLKTIAVNLCIDFHRRTGRVTVKDPTDETWPESTAPDEPLDSVLTRERRAKLEKALAGLPLRQRRALLLHVLEGWNYSQIASAEEVSLQAVKSLLFRARANLRKAEKLGVRGLVVVQLRALRHRMQRVAGRTGTRLEVAFSRLVETVQAIESAALVVAMALGIGFAGGPVGLTMKNADAQSHASVALGSAPARGVSPYTGGGSGGSAGDNVTRLVNQVTNPGADATPENTSFHSIVASPNYRHDHTVFAAGTRYCLRACFVLFSSHDGGVSWKREPAKSLNGAAIALPPAYPVDNRIFAMGAGGLQVSTDGGKSFVSANPLMGEFAISPGFDADDPRVLIAGAGTVMEYWPNPGLTTPSKLLLTPRASSTVAFAPGYSQNKLIFVGSVGAYRSVGTNQTTAYGSVIERCVDDMHCDQIPLRSQGDPFMAFSPRFAQDQTAYAFTGNALFRSTDTGRHFESVALPPDFSELDGISSVMVQAPSRSGLLLFVGFASSNGPDTGLYRSADGGSTWTRLHVNAKGFLFGVGAMTALDATRILVGGVTSGIVCSDDGGRTWSPRCAA